ncbi:MAG: hypothetical protein ACI4WX_12300 [Aristaeellaceae bacterium]
MAMVTDQCGRLIAYTCAELAAYTWAGVNSLPYGINRSFAAATNAAGSRETKLNRTQDEFEKIEIVSYSALATSINNLDAAVDKLLASMS